MLNREVTVGSNSPNVVSVSASKCGPVAQHGWSVRLIIERSPVRIRLGPPCFGYYFLFCFLFKNGFFYASIINIHVLQVHLTR